MTDSKLNEFPTPSLVLPTSFGHLLYTPRDLHDETTSNQLTILDIGDLIYRDFKSKPLRELSALPKNLVQILSFRGAFGESPNCDSKGISINSKAGRKLVTIENYVERITIDNPQMVVSLADEVHSSTTGHNRMKKAIDRTWQWYKTLVEKHATILENKLVFAVLLWDENHPQATLSLLDKILSLETTFLAGIVLSGFQNYSTTTKEQKATKTEYLQKIHVMIQQASSKHGNLKLMTQTADNFPQILDDLSHNIHIIHTNYPIHLTAKGYAMNFVEGKKFAKDPEAIALAKRSRETKEEAASKDDNEDDEENDRKPSKRARITEATTPLEETVLANTIETPQQPAAVNSNPEDEQQQQRTEMPPPQTFSKKKPLNTQQIQQQVKQQEKALLAASLSTEPILPDGFSINLWHESYRKDVQPLLPGCHCHACLHHTRAYIHHLLIAKELLAEVLLYQHNQFQMQQFFQQAQLKKQVEGEEVYQTWITSLLDQ